VDPQNLVRFLVGEELDQAHTLAPGQRPPVGTLWPPASARPLAA
jgi:hypothetical protein